jgi:hypothetical protein
MDATSYPDGRTSILVEHAEWEMRDQGLNIFVGEVTAYEALNVEYRILRIRSCRVLCAVTNQPAWICK